MDEREKIKANISARTEAIGWTGLNNAFGGKGDYIDLLPFPDIIRDQQILTQKSSISGATIQCVKRLHAMDKIPRHVITAIAAQAPEVSKILD